MSRAGTSARSEAPLRARAHVVVLRDARGRIDGTLAIHRDMTQEARVQAELRRSEAALREADRRNDHFLAVLSFGKPWSDFGLRQMFRRLAKRAGVAEGGTFHHLRHGFVTALLDRGVGAHVVQELAGHADLATTQRYAHAIAKQAHKAIDALNGEPIAAE